MARLRRLGVPCPLCGRELTSWDDRASRALGYLTYQVCEACLCEEYGKTQAELRDILKDFSECRSASPPPFYLFSKGAGNMNGL